MSGYFNGKHIMKREMNNIRILI